MTEISNETRFLHAIEMGLGAWQWGDRLVWQYGHDYGVDDVKGAFETSVNEGIRFVDTAEVYGNGNSERFLGKFIQGTDQPILIATKFFPYPWRFSKGAVPRALKGSLARIGVETVDLYQVHWPGVVIGMEPLMEGMAECVKSGMARTVGVSNYNQTGMLAAYSTLARQDIPLASNQVHYSLLNRKPEKDGTLARCKELGIRLIAYSPIEKGLLSGKYSAENPPAGTRRGTYMTLLGKIAPLIKAMTGIGQDHGGKSNVQVALNWVICKGALPIPGAKSAQQAHQNAGALGWKLTDAEVATLDQISDQVLK